jgi:hypothetical protein
MLLAVLLLLMVLLLLVLHLWIVMHDLRLPFIGGGLNGYLDIHGCIQGGRQMTFEINFTS